MNRVTGLVSEWFLGRSGRDGPPLTAAARLALFAGFVLIGFAVVYPLCALLQEPVAFLLAAAAQAATRLVSPWLEFSARGHDIYFTVRRRPSFEAWVDSRLIVANLPLLMTLVLVTPGMRWQRRVVRGIIAVAVLFSAHVALLITKVEVVLISAKHPLAGSPALWSMVDDFFEVVGKTFFPIVIWLALCLPYMLGAVDSRKEQALNQPALGRNSPCPCGSGKKYKKCCGAQGVAPLNRR
jgi:hypothetical protein